MSKKIATITTTVLATIGALTAAAVVLYKKGYLAVEVEKDELKEEPKEEIAEIKSEVVEPEVIEEAPKKRKILKKKTVKE